MRSTDQLLGRSRLAYRDLQTFPCSFVKFDYWERISALESFPSLQPVTLAASWHKQQKKYASWILSCFVTLHTQTNWLISSCRNCVCWDNLGQARPCQSPNLSVYVTHGRADMCCSSRAPAWNRRDQKIRSVTTRLPRLLPETLGTVDVQCRPPLSETTTQPSPASESCRTWHPNRWQRRPSRSFQIASSSIEHDLSVGGHFWSWPTSSRSSELLTEFCLFRQSAELGIILQRLPCRHWACWQDWRRPFKSPPPPPPSDGIA